MLPSGNRTDRGTQGGQPAMGSAALVPSTSTSDPWAGGCPIWTHSTAVSNTTSVGSHHGPSAGVECLSSSPCIL